MTIEVDSDPDVCFLCNGGAFTPKPSVATVALCTLHTAAYFAWCREQSAPPNTGAVMDYLYGQLCST